MSGFLTAPTATPTHPPSERPSAVPEGPAPVPVARALPPIAEKALRGEFPDQKEGLRGVSQPREVPGAKTESDHSLQHSKASSGMFGTPEEGLEACLQTCKSFNYCCNLLGEDDNIVGANGFISCTQACKIRFHGKTAKQCLEFCSPDDGDGVRMASRSRPEDEDDKPCDLTIDGHSYNVCQSCPDLAGNEDNCPKQGIDSTDNCESGCNFEDIYVNLKKVAPDAGVQPRRMAISDDAGDGEQTGASKGTMVACETTKGSIRISVREDWAPIGARRWLEMVKGGFFGTKVALFRCVNNFLCQTGIAGDPAVHAAWRKKGTIQDDVQWLDIPKNVKMRKGYLSFAGGGKNSRGTEFFFNYKDSDGLGRELWEVPFGTLVGAESFATMEKWYHGYGDVSAFGGHAPDQRRMYTDGLKYLEGFPKLDYITSCQIEADHRLGL